MGGGNLSKLEELSETFLKFEELVYRAVQNHEDEEDETIA